METYRILIEALGTAAEGEPLPAVAVRYTEAATPYEAAQQARSFADTAGVPDATRLLVTVHNAAQQGLGRYEIAGAWHIPEGATLEGCPEGYYAIDSHRGCKGCAFDGSGMCSSVKCLPDERPDRRSVIFKQIPTTNS